MLHWSRLLLWAASLLLISLTTASLCPGFLRSFDVGGIYFRAVPSGVCEPVSAKDIEFRVQPPGSTLRTNLSVVTPEDDTDQLKQLFDPLWPTAVYVHGFFEGEKASSVRAFRAAYVRRGGYNLILVNWQPLANAPWYPTAVHNFPLVSRRLSALLGRLLDTRAIRLEGLHLLGFSLGAHVCAVAARLLEFGGHRVPRITAMDPAYPLITQLPRALRLDRSCAEFVDVIHTCGGMLGLYRPAGHVDFYPNGGTYVQPGCLINIAPFTCSHWRSWRFFVESLQGGEFVGVACTSWRELRHSGSCSGGNSNRTARMGIDIDTTGRGIFYLKTSWHPPFALQHQTSAARGL